MLMRPLDLHHLGVCFVQWDKQGYAGMIGTGVHGSAAPRKHPCPIAITTTEAEPADHPVSFDWGEESRIYTLHNRPMSIDVRMTEGSSLTHEGRTWTLDHVNFRTPAETIVDDVAHPAEIHFIYRPVSGEREEGLLVVAVFLKEGHGNPLLAKILSRLPEEGRELLVEATDDLSARALEAFLPKVRRHFAFDGGLTSAPFIEPVRWIVMTQPVEASEAELKSLSEHLGRNNRAVQPLNNRRVSLSD